MTVSAYGRPVKPFDRPHPVRANFGDPRTTFHGPATQAGIPTSRGSFSFHFGVDIAVPDGTLVYPVRSGTATLLGGLNVQVDSGGGFKTQYWYIRPAIRQGQRVIAKQTVLGHVLKDTSTSTSPSSRTAAPSTRSRRDISACTPRRAYRCSARSPSAQYLMREALAESVSGAVVPVARAQDVTAQPVPGVWANLPVAPALLARHVERVPNGRVAIPRTVAFDVRTRISKNWRVLVVLRPRGTRQNASTFGTQRAWRTPGTYLYR